jgi:TolA-binding protein
MALELISVVAVAGAVASVLASTVELVVRRHRKKDETLEDRITKLTNALRESSHLVAEVEGEIKSRQNLVLELKKDAEKYQQLVTLNKEQVDAVAQLLQGELRKEGSKSFWKGVGVNFVFFVLGALVSWAMTRGF